MSVAKLRAGLTELIEALPTEEIGAAHRDIEAVLADMVETWRGSAHSDADAAPAAIRAALHELAHAAAGLAEAQAAVASYTRGL